MGWFSSKKEFPDARDVAIRALILRTVVSYGNHTPDASALSDAKLWWTEAEERGFLSEFRKDRDAIWATLGKYRKFLSPSEKELSTTTVETVRHQQLADASWRVESLGVLLWALNFVGRILPYDETTSPDFIGHFWRSETEPFIASAELRPRADISAAREMAEGWHWRSRTRQLIEDGTVFPDSPNFHDAGIFSFDDVVRKAAGYHAESGAFEMIDGDFPVFGKAYRDLDADQWSVVRSITIERHFALNWLSGYAPNHQWDETPTDT